MKNLAKTFVGILIASAIINGGCGKSERHYVVSRDYTKVNGRFLYPAGRFTIGSPARMDGYAGGHPEYWMAVSESELKNIGLNPEQEYPYELWKEDMRLRQERR